MLQAYAYALHLLSGFVLIAIFFAIYTKVTPFDEISLIRKGNTAAALSLSGALVGFSLTVGSAILHTDNLLMFLAWAAGAMVVQLACYAVMARSLPDMNAAIEGDNVAMGSLMAVSSLSIGIVNAACIS